MPDNTGKKQAKRRFQKGQSGNPSGRPMGARNAATMAAESLLDGESETLTRKAIELAKEGDGPALKLCLERIIPARKSRPIKIDLPEVNEPKDVLSALSATLMAVGKGELTPEEGQAISGLLEQTRRAQELVDLDARLQKLEKETGKRK